MKKRGFIYVSSYTVRCGKRNLRWIRGGDDWLFNFPLTISTSDPSGSGERNGHIWIKSEEASSCDKGYIVESNSASIPNNSILFLVNDVDDITINAIAARDDVETLSYKTDNSKKGWLCGYEPELTNEFWLPTPKIYTKRGGATYIEDAWMWNGSKWVMISQKGKRFIISDFPYIYNNNLTSEMLKIMVYNVMNYGKSNQTISLSSTLALPSINGLFPSGKVLSPNGMHCLVMYRNYAPNSSNYNYITPEGQAYIYDINGDNLTLNTSFNIVDILSSNNLKYSYSVSISMSGWTAYGSNLSVRLFAFAFSGDGENLFLAAKHGSEIRLVLFSKNSSGKFVYKKIYETGANVSGESDLRITSYDRSNTSYPTLFAFADDGPDVTPIIRYKSGSDEYVLISESTQRNSNGELPGSEILNASTFLLYCRQGHYNSGIYNVEADGTVSKIWSSPITGFHTHQIHLMLSQDLVLLVYDLSTNTSYQSFRCVVASISGKNTIKDISRNMDEYASWMDYTSSNLYNYDVENNIGFELGGRNYNSETSTYNISIITRRIYASDFNGVLIGDIISENVTSFVGRNMTYNSTDFIAPDQDLEIKRSYYG